MPFLRNEFSKIFLDLFTKTLLTTMTHIYEQNKNFIPSPLIISTLKISTFLKISTPFLTSRKYAFYYWAQYISLRPEVDVGNIFELYAFKRANLYESLPTAWKLREQKRKQEFLKLSLKSLLLDFYHFLSKFGDKSVKIISFLMEISILPLSLRSFDSDSQPAAVYQFTQQISHPHF